MNLTEEMKRLVREQRLGYVATVSPDGSPNLSPKGTTTVWDDDHLIFADLRSPGTVQNLRSNPRVEVNVVHPILRKGYRFAGTADVYTEGPFFVEAVRFFGERQSVRQAKQRINSVVLVHVERAAPLISPSYELGVSEEEVIAHWQRYYASLGPTALAGASRTFPTPGPSDESMDLPGKGGQPNQPSGGSAVELAAATSLLDEGASSRRRGPVPDSVDVVLRSFRAVERWEDSALVALEHPDVEFHWPSSLPYGGTLLGKGALRSRDRAETWSGTWRPLQPTEVERRMDPRVVAASDDEVVVLWHQRAVDAAGERLDELVLGLYLVRDGLLARAQMFYFDAVAVKDYLARAKRPAATARPRGTAEKP